ncbi:MAG: glycosyltransferase family 1 protein [Chloroflexota bacterium]
MRIALDGRVASRHFPGIGRYALHLIGELLDLHSSHDLFVLYDPGRNPAVAALARAEESRLGGPRARFVAVPVPMRSPAEQVALPALATQLRLDLFHATYYALPPLLPGRIVVTLYDMIPHLYPAYWPNPLVRTAIAAWSTLALRRAAAVLTLSSATRDDLRRVYGPLAGKPITVTPCGADRRFLRLGEERLTRGESLASERGPFFLYVGINKPHKNLPRLVEAFALYRQGGGAGRLVVAGRWDPRYPAHRIEAERRGLGDSVEFRQDVSDEELATLYSTAHAFVLPSLYEGFGFPVLEAMAAAAPVLTSTTSSLPEIGGDAVLYCDPLDASSIAAGMTRLDRDPALRARLSRDGHRRAGTFNWRHTAELTMAAYEAALGM